MTSTPATTRLARAITVHLAWREDDNAWDGFALYLDEDTAKAAAADDWEAYEYGGFDEDDERTRPLLTWETAYDRWVLLDDGRDTGVRVNAMAVHRKASKNEIEAQDALAAAKEAARAVGPHMPMAMALEHEVAKRTAATPAP